MFPLLFTSSISSSSKDASLCFMAACVTERSFIQEVNKEERTSCFMLNHTLKVERCYDDDHIVVNSVFCNGAPPKLLHKTGETKRDFLHLENVTDVNINRQASHEK